MSPHLDAVWVERVWVADGVVRIAACTLELTVACPDCGRGSARVHGRYERMPVGFGDITAKSQAARLVVTGQMITELVVVGLATKVIIGAARTRKCRPTDPEGASRAHHG